MPFLTLSNFAYTKSYAEPPERPAFITSSSGTTVDGFVKGVVATNESALSQVFSVSNSEIRYSRGSRILNHFPPAAATSLHSLFILGLYQGSTILIDPRVSESDFYNQLVNLRPNFCINTSSSWELFFNRIEKEIESGKKFDFSYAIGWMIGGEGTVVSKLKKWKSIMQECQARTLFFGYGLSETFSGICLDNYNHLSPMSKQIVGVGLVQAGMTVGIFDGSGKELSYNQRGEMWVKTKAAMKGYYNKPELTALTKIDGWIHTGDLAEIDENGFVYIWGRIKDAFEYGDNKIYLFDVAYKILENDFIEDAIVLPMVAKEDAVSLVAHIVWSGNPTTDEQIRYIEELNASINEYLPQSIVMVAYSVHDTMLPYSPTTLKKDKNKLSKQTTGYIQVVNGKMQTIAFASTSEGSTYEAKQ